MPKEGFKSNNYSLNSNLLQDFMLTNVTPEKIIIISNCSDHSKFVKNVNDDLVNYSPVKESEFSRQKSSYIGGEYRAISENKEVNVTLAYDSFDLNHNMLIFRLLHLLFGSGNKKNVIESNNRSKDSN